MDMTGILRHMNSCNLYHELVFLIGNSVAIYSDILIENKSIVNKNYKFEKQIFNWPQSHYLI